MINQYKQWETYNLAVRNNQNYFFLIIVNEK